MLSLLRTLLTGAFVAIFASQQIKHLLSLKLLAPGQYTRFHLGKCLHYLLLFSYMFRSLVLCLHVHLGGRPLDCVYFSPVLATIMANYHFVDAHTGALISLLLWLPFTLDYAYFFRLDADQAKLLYEVVVDNADQLVALNGRKLKHPLEERTRWRQPVEAVLKQLALLRSIWSCPKLRFKHRQLGTLPYLSGQLRARVMVVSVLLEWLIAGVNLHCALTMLFFSSTNLALMYPHLPTWPTVLLATIDEFSNSYNCFNSIRIALALLHHWFLIAFLTNRHIDQLNGRLKRSKLSTLSFFYAEHARLKAIAVGFNATVASPVMWTSFLSTTVLNIHMISVLLFGHLSTSEKILMSFITFFQIQLNMSTAQVLIYWSGSLYRSDGLLFRGQLQLKSTGVNVPRREQTHLRMAKLKLLTFYESVCSDGGQLKFTLGPLTTISQKTLAEFLITYSGFIMYISKTVIKEQLKQSSNVVPI